MYNLKQTATIILTAGMVANNMGLTTLAETITKPLVDNETKVDTSSVSTTKSQKEILTDAILEAQSAVKTKEQIVKEALAEVEKATPAYTESQSVYNTTLAKKSSMEVTINQDLIDSISTQAEEIKLVKEDLDNAKSEQESYNQARDKAMQSAQDALDNKKKAQKAYEQAVEDAKSLDLSDDNIKELENEYDEAQAVEAQKKDEYNAALTHQSELESVVIEKNEAVTSKTKEYNTLQDNLLKELNKLTALQNELKTLTEELNNLDTDNKVEEANQKISALNEEITTLQNEISNNETNINTLSSEISTLETELQTQNTALENATAATNTALEDYTAKQKASADAKTALESAKTNLNSSNLKLEDLNKKIQTTKAAYDVAKAAYDEEVAKLDDLSKAVVTAKNNVDSLQSSYDNAVEKYNLGIVGFLKEVDPNNSYVLANKYFATDNNYDMNLGGENDPTSLENMIKAIDYIKECNALRKAGGVDELKVDTISLVYATDNAGFNIQQLNNHQGYSHSGMHAGGENIAIGPEEWDPFEGWYEEEYALYQQALKETNEDGSLKYPGLEGMSSYKCYTTYEELWHELGHWYNIMDPTYKYTGYALGSTKSSGVESNQIFSKTQSGVAYTVEEYEKVLTTYTDSINEKIDAYNTANKTYQKALKEYNDAASQLKTYGEYSSTKLAYETAKSNYDNEHSNYETLQEVVKTADGNLTTAQQNESTAKTTYKTAIQTQNSEQTKYDGIATNLKSKNISKSELEKANEEKNNTITTKQSQIKSLQNDITTYRNDESLAMSKIIDKNKEINNQENNIIPGVEKQVDEAFLNMNSAVSEANIAVTNRTNYASTVTKAEEALVAAVNTTNSLKSSIDHIKNVKTTIDEYESVILKYENDYEGAQKSIEDYEAEIESLQNDIKAITDEIETLSEKSEILESLQVAFNELKSGNIDAEIPEVYTMRTASSAQALRAKIVEYKELLHTLKSDKEKLDETKSVYDTKLEVLNTAKSEYASAVASQTKAENDLTDYLAKLKAEEEAAKKAEEAKKTEESSTSNTSDKTETSVTATVTNSDSNNTNGVNTGVTTGIGLYGAGVAISAAGINKTRRKLSRRNRK